MRYNRKEAFRYEFGKPVDCTVKVLVDQNLHSDQFAEGLLHDISPRGLKFSCPLNLPLNKEKILVEVRFILNIEPIILKGELRWKKDFGQNFYYGFELVGTEKDQDQLINELKVYSKRVLNKRY